MRSEILPYYLFLGVSESEFWDSCPADLKPYEKAFEMKQKIQDENMWRMGIYIQNSVSVAIEHNLAGRKAKSKYLEEPILRSVERKKETDRPLTEDEKKEQTEQLFMRLRLMQSNFNLNNKGGSVS